VTWDDAWLGQAALWYSWIVVPGTCRRWIRPSGDDLGWVCVRWCLISALVGPVPVEVVFVGGEHLAGVGFAEQ